MNCTDAKPMIGAFVDDELAGADGARLRQHSATCSHCAEELVRLQALRLRVRAVRRFAAPEHLDRRVRQAIAGETPAPPRRRVATAFGFGVASGGALAGALALALVWAMPVAPAGSTADYVSAYARGQRAALEQGILSGDPHTIRPWIAGRSDLAPRVADLSDEGFPLLGARLDHVAGHPAVAVVYGRRKHKINLFVQAAAGATAPRIAGTRHGFTVVSWQDQDLLFVAVSEIAEQELREFMQLFRQRTASPGPS